MSNEFEDEFVSSCGGPQDEYPFDDWSESGDVVEPMDNANAQWRRPADAPTLRPGFYAQMSATRCESQIGADWMCVPAARNLHW
eukprot:10328932-Karenia_brevis.AAC.1